MVDRSFTVSPFKELTFTNLTLPNLSGTLETWDRWYEQKYVVFLGMFAIRAERDYVIQEDFMKAVRKLSDNKKLETKLDYKPV